MIKAITFDLWDTIIHDDSDEPKRASQGLRTKRDARRHLVWSALNNISPISEAEVISVYDTTDAAFNKVWHEQFVTWTIRERLEIILKGLGRTLPPHLFDEVATAHEEMEITILPDMIEGAAQSIAELASEFPLAIVSDAIVSPGRCLRTWLELNGLLKHFTGFAFSDEVGHSKPHRDMFARAAAEMGVAIQDMVHIGDRDHNDVKGPHALGMKAILFTATRDKDREITTADGICDHHKDLPGMIHALNHQ